MKMKTIDRAWNILGATFGLLLIAICCVGIGTCIQGRQEPIVIERIVQVPQEGGFEYREDIPLLYTEQAALYAACELTGCPMDWALATIWGETKYQNLDHGDVQGYMSVSESANLDRMERLGVTNLMNPCENFLVGCDLLAYLVEKYEDPHDVVMCYVCGEHGAEKQWAKGHYTDDYIENLLAYMEGLNV